MLFPCQSWGDAAHKAVLGAICWATDRKGYLGGPPQKQGMLHVAGQCVSALHSSQSSHSHFSHFCLLLQPWD